MGKTGQDFTTWKGNYRRIDFYIEDVSSVTGGTAKWIMSTGSTATALITKSSTTGGVGLTGKTCSVYLVPTDTDDASGIPPGEYYHELRLEDIAGQPSTPAIGTVTLLPVVLKS